MFKKLVLLLIIPLSFLFSSCLSEGITITATYFDEQVILERARTIGFQDDRLIFVFMEPGTYDVAFFKDSKSISIPENFSIIVSDTPKFKVIFQHVIPDLKISITKDGNTESHGLLLP